MLYRFYDVTGPNQIDLGFVNLDSWSRPRLGQEIQVFGKNYKVAYCVPAANADETPVAYYLERI